MKLIPTFDRLALAAAAAFALVAPLPAAATALLENPAQPTTEAGHLERVASFERHGSPTDPAYVAALTGLSLFYVNQGRHADAVPVLRRALAASERLFGPDHDTTREIRTTLLMLEAFLRQQQ